MKLKLILAASCLAFSLPSAAQEASPPLQTELEAYLVQFDDAGKENLILATNADPGQIIEYQLSYHNVSDGDLSKVILNAGVPNSSEYLSHQNELSVVSTVEVKTADIAWAEPPLKRAVKNENGEVQFITVSPNEYSGVRWKLNSPLSAGEKVNTSYRVRIEQ